MPGAMFAYTNVLIRTLRKIFRSLSLPSYSFRCSFLLRDIVLSLHFMCMCWLCVQNYKSTSRSHLLYECRGRFVSGRQASLSPCVILHVTVNLSYMWRGIVKFSKYNACTRRRLWATGSYAKTNPSCMMLVLEDAYNRIECVNGGNCAHHHHP